MIPWKLLGKVGAVVGALLFIGGTVFAGYRFVSEQVDERVKLEGRTVIQARENLELRTEAKVLKLENQTMKNSIEAAGLARDFWVAEYERLRAQPPDVRTIIEVRDNLDEIITAQECSEALGQARSAIVSALGTGQ